MVHAGSRIEWSMWRAAVWRSVKHAPDWSHDHQPDGGTNTTLQLHWIQWRFSPTWTSDDSVTARRSTLQNSDPGRAYLKTKLVSPCTRPCSAARAQHTEQQILCLNNSSGFKFPFLVCLIADHSARSGNSRIDGGANQDRIIHISQSRDRVSIWFTIKPVGGGGGRVAPGPGFESPSWSRSLDSGLTAAGYIVIAASPVTTRASNKGFRRFHNHREGPYLGGHF